MSNFKIDDYIHFGLNKGPTTFEFELAYDLDFKYIITKGTTKAESLFEFNDNMRIEEIPYGNTVVDVRDMNNGKGIYWNGDNPLNIRARSVIEGVKGDWIYSSWIPDFRSNDGSPIPPKNPIDFNNLKNYTRQG